MAQAPATLAPRRARPEAWGIALFSAVAVGGLYYVKWHPYFHKALAAAAHHSLGASLLTGARAAAPAPGLAAAWSYAVHYGLDIWQALLVGLLLGAGVQVLLPRDWLLRVLGRGRFGETSLAAAAAVPSMM